MNKSSKIIIWTTITLSILSIPLLLFWLPNQIDKVVELSLKYPVFIPFLLVFWRFLSIVIPPLPGGLVSLAFIPVFGWWQSFVYSSIGVLIGTSTAFFLARRFREPFVKRFVPLQQLHAWQEKISDKTQFFAFVGIRFTTGSVMDYISYIAGLSKMSYKIYFGATALNLFSDLVLFYIGGKAYEYSAYLAMTAVVLFALLYYLNSKFKFFKIKL